MQAMCNECECPALPLGGAALCGATPSLHQVSELPLFIREQIYLYISIMVKVSTGSGSFVDVPNSY